MAVGEGGLLGGVGGEEVKKEKTERLGTKIHP